MKPNKVIDNNSAASRQAPVQLEFIRSTFFLSFVFLTLSFNVLRGYLLAKSSVFVAPAFSGFFLFLVMAPIFEEFAFRGVMLERLLQKGNIMLPRRYFGVSLANILVSILFMSVHGTTWFFVYSWLSLPTSAVEVFCGLMGAILLFVWSLYYGAVYERYRIITFSIFMHFTANLIGSLSFWGV